MEQGGLTQFKVALKYPVNTKHFYNICTMLDQRRRRWAGVVQMVYNCFVFARYAQLSFQSEEFLYYKIAQVSCDKCHI